MAERSIIDFETDEIKSRPLYPPRPVGCAIQWPDKKREYLAWGHPTKNNTDVATARRKIVKAWAMRPIFHNSAFDIDVGQCHLGLPMPEKFGDTLFLAFLQDPYAESLSLKPLAEKDYGIPPDEQEAVRDWLVRHKICKKNQKDWGAHIAEAPGDIVGEYAIGDVYRTGVIHKGYLADVRERGMLEAYHRELAVTPITIEMERSGVRVHRKRLRKALEVFETMDQDLIRRIAKKLRISPKDMPTDAMSDKERKGKFNLNSGKQLADALMRAGKLDSVVRTPSGQVSTKVTVLKETCNDKELINLLAIHSVAEKYMGTFMRPWLKQADLTGGRILPHFNQVRNRTEDGGGGGARSGRYSSSDPNMQQVASNPEESGNKEVLMLMQKWLIEDYGYHFFGLRDYIIPDEGKIMIAVDYNQQELRILAHFEADVLMRAYLKDPLMDIHEFCRQLVFKATGVLYERKHIKVTVFGIVYGMGLEKLAARLGIDRKEAGKIRKGIYDAIPGIKKLQKELRALADFDKPLKTWGGREYFCEEPKTWWNPNTRRREMMSFEHKMLNYKIQPSAADCTKQGMINVRNECENVRIAIQVHDELVCMADSIDDGPRIEHAMGNVNFKVPMIAEAKYSTTSWARAAKLKKAA